MDKKGITLDRRLKFDEWDSVLEFSRKTFDNCNLLENSTSLLEQLNNNQRIIVQMNFVEGISLTRIAKYLNISVHAVMRSRDRALKQIGKKYILYTLAVKVSNKNKRRE